MLGLGNNCKTVITRILVGRPTELSRWSWMTLLLTNSHITHLLTCVTVDPYRTLLSNM